MTSTAVSRECGIDNSTDLEDVFLYFVRSLPPTPPVSVAEAKFTDKELACLKCWFSELTGKPRNWCDDPWQISLGEMGTASPQEMFGALLIILAAEVCRAKSNEEELWPAAAGVLQADKITFPALFATGRQPSALFKKAISAGARRLNLRNLIDCSGRLEFADTIRLQFGFTRRGALKRLPEWLDGLGRPVAVRILLGEEDEFSGLRSASFTKLWKTLRDFRRRLVEKEYAASVLASSPWTRPEWTDELLGVCGQRPNRISTSRPEEEHGLSAQPDSSEDADLSSEPICELSIQWPEGSKPRLQLRLDRDRVSEILTGKQKAAFAVDGLPVGTWVAAEGGGWHGAELLPCEPERRPANLRPGFLAITGDGEILEEIDLSDLRTKDALLIFDSTNGSLLCPAARLDPRRAYVVICDSDLSVAGAAQSMQFKSRSAYRLEAPWPDDLIVVCDGLQYRRLAFAEGQADHGPDVVLESLRGECGKPGSICSVALNGIPDGVGAVSLSIGAKTCVAVQEEQGWRASIQITPQLAFKRERIRVRISGRSLSRLVIPKLRIGVRGLACAEADGEEDTEFHWEFLREDRALNRAGGSGSVRIFVDLPDAQLYEGRRRVGRIGARPLPLRDLQAWGAPLFGRSHDGTEFPIVASVEDHGMGRFQPSLFAGRTPPAFRWRAPLSPENDHEILIWSNLLLPPQRVKKSQIECQKEGLVWKFPHAGPVAAMAVAYRGERIASFWNIASITQALQVNPTAELFAILRWLHVPVLSSELVQQMNQAVERTSPAFVRGWLSNNRLRNGLIHRSAEDGLDTVVREFLWNFSERDESRLDGITFAFPERSVSAPGQTDADRFKRWLLHLSEVCPSLAYALALAKMRGDKYRRAVRFVAASLLRQPADAEAETMRGCLGLARYQAAALADITPDALEGALAGFGAYLDKSASDFTKFEPSLRRLGETDRGRSFITAALLVRAIDGSGC